MPTIDINAGTIHYEATGPENGRPVVFVHGYMMGGLGYALFGSSRQLATGPVAVVSLLTASALAPIAATQPQARPVRQDGPYELARRIGTLAGDRAMRARVSVGTMPEMKKAVTVFKQVLDTPVSTSH